MTSDRILALMALMRDIETPSKTYNAAVRQAARAATGSAEDEAARKRGGAALLEIEQAVRRWVAEHPVGEQAPPADLRDRIVEALVSWAYHGKAPEHGGILETVRANAYSRADAVMAVLSEPADQAGYAQGIRDAIAELKRDALGVIPRLERMAAETPQPDLTALAAMFEGLERLISTNSRDWGESRVDAWLWAVLVGWDCEQDEHDDTCTHGALEEVAQRYGWDEETVAKARRYRVAVRAVGALRGTEA